MLFFNCFFSKWTLYQLNSLSYLSIYSMLHANFLSFSEHWLWEDLLLFLDFCELFWMKDEENQFSAGYLNYPHHHHHIYLGLNDKITEQIFPWRKRISLFCSRLSVLKFPLAGAPLQLCCLQRELSCVLYAAKGEIIVIFSIILNMAWKSSNSRA